jgi:glutamyl-tRNA synthetase
MAEISAFFYRDFDTYEEKSARKHLRQAASEPLEKVRQALATIDDWQPESLHQAVVNVAAQIGLGLGKVAQPLRVAVVGRAASPGIDTTLYLVGRKACLRRIDTALNHIAQSAAGN